MPVNIRVNDIATIANSSAIEPIRAGAIQSEESSDLFPREEMRAAGGYPALTYTRLADGDGPIFVFIPGGSHLARIAYGDPGSRKEDFLDYWLECLEASLVAISYPLQNAVYGDVYPQMSVDDWGASASAVAKDILTESESPLCVTLVGWSMGGKIVNAFCHHARRIGLKVDGFVSIAATAPLPGLAASSPGLITLNQQGLRDTSSREGAIDRLMWRRGLAEQNDIVGRTIIDDQTYRRSYRGDYPLQLRGEPERVSGNVIVKNWQHAIEDLGSFRFADYPLTGNIIPTSQDDARHALTDQATWAMINTQVAYARYIEHQQLAPDNWQRAREIVSQMHGRLARHVQGGHFCFVGEPGARSVAESIVDLHLDLQSVSKELRQVGRVGR